METVEKRNREQTQASKPSVCIYSQLSSSPDLTVEEPEAQRGGDVDDHISVTQVLWKADASVHDYIVSVLSQGRLSSRRYHG